MGTHNINFMEKLEKHYVGTPLIWSYEYFRMSAAEIFTLHAKH